MDDLISRQAALAEIDRVREELLALKMDSAEHILVHYGRRVIEEQPTIEPKRGKWIPNSPFTGNCSECGGNGNLKDNYCSNCGAIMGDDWEEPEINPCRGCGDYDGRGGCKSHGGCGAERE